MALSRFAATHTFVLAAASFAAAAAGVALADGPRLDPAQFAPPPADSVFHFRRAGHPEVNATVVVGDHDDLFVRYTVNGQRRNAALVSRAAPDSLPATELATLKTIWPLEVGKHVRYQRFRPHSADAWDDDVTVTGTETVTIGGKPLDTYVVRWHSAGQVRNPWEGTMTVWYAPALGWNVRIRYEDTAGERYDDELVGYTLAAR